MVDTSATTKSYNINLSFHINLSRMARQKATLDVWLWPGHVLDDAAKKLRVKNVVLIPQRTFWGQNTNVELLAQVTIFSMLRPQVPHTGIVECQHDCCPRFGEDLNGVSAHGIKKVVVLPLLWGPLPWFYPVDYRI